MPSNDNPFMRSKALQDTVPLHAALGEVDWNEYERVIEDQLKGECDTPIDHREILRRAERDMTYVPVNPKSDCRF